MCGSRVGFISSGWDTHREDGDERAGGEPRGGMPRLVFACAGRFVIEETLLFALGGREQHGPHRRASREAAE